MANEKLDETDSGRPYFVMELVKGQPITQYCDERQLTPHERLELFLPVCQAIQHAHQKGIIHRDVKPSNILVAEYDHQAVPKVIDFGVAKATSQALTEKTMFTGFGQIIGTLEYMSPEQAKVNQLDIDTRSDIYSLGVLLYEEPPLPSTRLSQFDLLASIAANRKTEPKRLSGIVRGELDWIVMKALEKQRHRRYESALHLADDLNRFLRSEMVLARPASTFYSISKFTMRHRVALLFSSMILMLLVAGIIGTAFGMLRALRSQQDAINQRRIAEQNSVRANDAALESERTRKEEKEQRERADFNASELAVAFNESQTLLYAKQLMVVRTEARWGNPLVAQHVLQETDPKKRGWEYAYLSGMLHDNRKDLDAGFGEISDVERAYVGGSVGTLLETSLGKNREPKNIAKAKGMLMRGIALSHDEKTMGVIGADDLNEENSLLYFQDLTTGELTQKMDLGDWHGTAIEFSPDDSTIACGSAERFRYGAARGVRLISVESGKVVGELTGNVNTVTCLAFSSDGTRLYGGGALDGSVSIWDLTTMKRSSKLMGMSGGLFSLAVNDDKGLLVGGGFSQVHLCNLNGRPFQQTLEETDQMIREAVIHANGTRVLATVGMPTLIPHSDGKFDVINRGQVVSWDLNSGRSKILADAISPSMQLIASPTGHLAATLHFDKTVRLWNLDTEADSEIYKMKVRDYAGSIAFVGEEALLIGDGMQLKRIEVENGSVQRTYPVQYDITHLVTDRAGKLAAIDSLKRFAVIDLNSGNELFHREFEEWSERRFCFSTDGGHLIYVANHREVECLSIPSGEIVWKKTIDGAQLGSFTSNDERLILGSYMDVLVLDASTGSKILSIPAHEDIIQSVFLSPDGKNLLTVGLDNQIHVNNLP